ncbi:MAG TPA: M3 family oligoendopeptidase [Gemmatimonadaceae bacterium]|nr:M3 family oligoendopeptidase [Gemmatimonadaceae bacterium]
MTLNLMLPTLPVSPAALADATWQDIEPHYEALAETTLGAGVVPAWLQSWSALDAIVDEAAALAYMAYTGNTADPEAEARNLRFSMEILPEVERYRVRLAERLVASGYTEPDLETTLREFRTDIEIFRDENVPLVAALEELGSSYQKVVGTMTVLWEGEPRTIQQLQPFLQVTDRAVRERAFRLSAEPYIDKRDELATIFDRMVELRGTIARNAGFADYQAYAFQELHRFDYGPEDCVRFHDAVAESVVPAVERMYAARRARLGVETLRPWDLGVDPGNRTALRPFDDVGELIAGGERIFSAVDPELGRQFTTMAREGLLDLENRQGKAPGGYCLPLHHRGRPFVHMNAVGIADDVSTLIHEAGHCFHTFASAPLSLVWQRGTGMEAAELASMSMELLAAPHLARPTGFYNAAEARRARIEHLEDVLASLPHIAGVDAFQRWIYTSDGGRDRAARDAEWLRIRSRLERGIDWDGLEAERVARWYRQIHIFKHPFYYIEYGIAQLGALQLWRQSLDDPRGALERYKSALALGGTRPLPAMYGRAGVALLFDAGAMKELVELVEHELQSLRDADG